MDAVTGALAGSSAAALELGGRAACSLTRGVRGGRACELPAEAWPRRYGDSPAGSSPRAVRRFACVWVHSRRSHVVAPVRGHQKNHFPDASLQSASQPPGASGLRGRLVTRRCLLWRRDSCRAVCEHLDKKLVDGSHKCVSRGEKIFYVARDE